MKRICVLAVYDPEGIVDDYLRHMIETLDQVSNDIYVIVNGKLQNDSRQYLEKRVRILQRENKGYDGGAYQYFFKEYRDKIHWENYDELLLMNDTFYGPIGEWQLLFQKMQEKNVDFWGLSRWKDGYVSMLDMNVPEHIQSYFLAVRKTMFLSNEFTYFWEKMKLPENYEDAIKNFEINFTGYFKKRGYSYISYLDVMGGKNRIHTAENVSLQYPLELISEYNFPIIKRRVFNLTNFKKIYSIMQYIKKYDLYDGEIIRKHIYRLDEITPQKPFSFHEVQGFVCVHSKIYFYGHGKIAENLSAYFEYKGWKIKAYVVTQKNDKDTDDVIEWKDFQMQPEDGLIIALGQKNAEEVYDVVINKYKKAQILLPKYN